MNIKDIRIDAIANNNIVVHVGRDKALFSYGTLIATVEHPGKVTLTTKWNHSPTTSKHRAKFLGEPTKDTQKKLLEGEYKLWN